MNDTRFEDALKQIGDINFTGRASSIGLRVKEIIRQAFNPDEPCPQCEGEGKVPQIRTPDCGDCISYTCSGPWSGDCGKGHEIQDEIDPICSEFTNRFPMQTCPSCGGKKCANST